MAERDPLINPRCGDVVFNNGTQRTIIYTTVYGKVYYANPADARKETDLNSYRKWAEGGDAQAAAHPGWDKVDAMVGNQALTEAQKICDHFADNFQHPTRDLVIETLLEFGIAYACSNAHGREKVYAVLRRKIKEKLG